MTRNIEVLRAYNDAAWSNPPSSVMKAEETYLSDDFKSLDQDGEVVMDKEAYIGMSHLLFDAFENFKWIRSDLREEGDSVIMSGHFEGTHTGDLDLSAVGMGIIPASGKMIVWPKDSVMYKVEDDKIVTEEPYGDSRGVGGFLEVLGVKAPSA